MLARFFVTTTTGAVQLWQHDRMMWAREESLAEIKLAEFVELPEPKAAASHLEEGGESFFSRLVRQASDAKVRIYMPAFRLVADYDSFQNLPSYLINFAKRFATGSYASASSSAASPPPAPDASGKLLTRDEFGFRKIVVVATARGTIYGINSGDGSIVWSRILGLGWAAEVGGHHVPVKLFVTRTVSDGEGASPQVVLVTQRKADNVRTLSCAQ